MISIIFILSINLLFWAMVAGLLVRIRDDVYTLREQNEENIDLIEQLMKIVVGHEDMQILLNEINNNAFRSNTDLFKQAMSQVVSHKDMNNYLNDINNKIINSKRDQSKERWKNYESAFGGKEEGKD